MGATKNGGTICRPLGRAALNTITSYRLLAVTFATVKKSLIELTSVFVWPPPPMRRQRYVIGSVALFVTTTLTVTVAPVGTYWLCGSTTKKGGTVTASVIGCVKIDALASDMRRQYVPALVKATLLMTRLAM